MGTPSGSSVRSTKTPASIITVPSLDNRFKKGSFLHHALRGMSRTKLIHNSPRVILLSFAWTVQTIVLRRLRPPTVRTTIGTMNDSYTDVNFVPI
jgi:hypothetical protein